MSDLHSISKEALSVLAEKGSFPYSFTLTESEKRELNTEGSEFSLFRTVFNRQIKKVVSDALSGAESALPDEANCIAEKETPEIFRNGSDVPDMEKFYSRLSELLDAIRSSYPKIRILQLIADHTKTHTLYQNSSDTQFEDFDGVYHVILYRYK